MYRPDCKTHALQESCRNHLFPMGLRTLARLRCRRPAFDVSGTDTGMPCMHLCRLLPNRRTWSAQRGPGSGGRRCARVEGDGALPLPKPSLRVRRDTNRRRMWGGGPNGSVAALDGSSCRIGRPSAVCMGGVCAPYGCVFCRRFPDWHIAPGGHGVDDRGVHLPSARSYRQTATIGPDLRRCVPRRLNAATLPDRSPVHRGAGATSPPRR